MDIREQAKQAGIDKWHVKSEERLKEELDALNAQSQPASEHQDLRGDEGRQGKAYFASGYSCYCSEAGLEQIKQQFAQGDFLRFEVI
jgi:hypothetical protein